jgi:uncharacterized membrane protein YccC
LVSQYARADHHQREMKRVMKALKEALRHIKTLKLTTRKQLRLLLDLRTILDGYIAELQETPPPTPPKKRKKRRSKS